MVRPSSLSAAGLSKIFCAIGSHLILLLVRIAIMPRYPGVANRSATSGGAIVRRRVITHSRKLR